MLLWILIIAASVILDQASKLLVVNTMGYGESIVLIKNIFSFQYIHNYGAAWGMFSEHRWVFMLITSVALIAMPIILYRYRKLHFLFGLSLSLFIGGAIGNMVCVNSVVATCATAGTAGSRVMVMAALHSRAISFLSADLISIVPFLRCKQPAFRPCGSNHSCYDIQLLYSPHVSLSIAPTRHYVPNKS
jgi:hypothetical protein